MMETVMRGYIKLLKENRLMLVKKGSKLCCKKKKRNISPLFDDFFCFLVEGDFKFFKEPFPGSGEILKRNYFDL